MSKRRVSVTTSVCAVEDMGDVTVYGIEICDDAGTQTVQDISDKYGEVCRLRDMMEREDVSSYHLRDIVEDYLNR